MKDRKKRAQREEVRKILKVMREELAAHRLAHQHEPFNHPGIHLNELIEHAEEQVRPGRHGFSAREAQLG